MLDKKIAIIGLGLIGGSIARAIRERIGECDVTAVNISMDSIDQAVSDGNIKRGFTVINDYVFSSDIIFLCTPVKQTKQYLCDIAGKVKQDCIITDVCSTKAEIIDYVNAMPYPPCFIGGHPMAGAEKAGYSASSSHLFENAYYILTPCKSTNNAVQEIMTAFVKSIGGIPIVIDANEHDRITGSISHVPHVIASALVNMAKKLDTEDGKIQMLAAGGFRDNTRIASSNPEMWENITLSNNKLIIEILDSFIDLLEDFKGSVVKRNSEKIYSFFEEAKRYRDALPINKRGLIPPAYEVIVDVVDQPGIIGKLATLLGKNNINIKNINVSNSREFEQGCLRITLPDSESANFAFDLLTGKGYKVYKIC